MKYARITDGKVAEIIELDKGLKIADCYHPAIVATMKACDDAVKLGWLYEDGSFIEPETTEPHMPLSEVQANLKAFVDSSAEAERLKYITPGHGQAMTYQQKVAEAQAFKAANNPLASDYPILSSEVGITAATIDEVASIVLAAFAQWQQIGAMIESIRLGAKRDIDAAEDEAAARAIVDAIVWPSAQVQS